MTTSSRDLSSLLAVLAVAAGLAVAPARFQDRVRSVVRDSAAPTQRLVRRGLDHSVEAFERRFRKPSENETSVAALEEELAKARRRIRALEAAVATVNDEKAELKMTGAAPWRGTAGTPLFVEELQSAAVLGAENADLIRQGKLLDAGTAQGLVESSLVLDDPRPLIDQGEAAGLAPGQSVFAGRCIVGRVARVGRRVSTVLPIGDPEFRGLARIIRGEGEEAVFGVEGLLEGSTDGLCRLRHIPATEPVSEGDRVYTAGSDATGPVPMFYGTVVSADLPTAATHWNVVLRPAVEWSRVKTVAVLRKRLHRDEVVRRED